MRTQQGKEAASNALCDTLAINNQPRTVELGPLASQASLLKLGPQAGMLHMLLRREQLQDGHPLPLESTAPADNEGSVTGGGHREMNGSVGGGPNNVSVNHGDQQAPELDTQEAVDAITNHLWGWDLLCRPLAAWHGTGRQSRPVFQIHLESKAA